MSEVFTKNQDKERELTGGSVGNRPHLLWAHSEYLGNVYAQGSHGVVNDLISRNLSDLQDQSRMGTPHIAAIAGLHWTHPQQDVGQAPYNVFLTRESALHGPTE